MLFPKLSCACIPCFKSVAPRVCLAKVPFLAFFEADMNTEMGVVMQMYLKHYPDKIDSKYIWDHGSNSLGSSDFAEIPVWNPLALHRERKRCNPLSVTPRVNLNMHTKC